MGGMLRVEDAVGGHFFAPETAPAVDNPLAGRLATLDTRLTDIGSSLENIARWQKRIATIAYIITVASAVLSLLQLWWVSLPIMGIAVILGLVSFYLGRRQQGLLMEGQRNLVEYKTGFSDLVAKSDVAGRSCLRELITKPAMHEDSHPRYRVTKVFERVLPPSAEKKIYALFFFIHKTSSAAVVSEISEEGVQGNIERLNEQTQAYQLALKKWRTAKDILHGLAQAASIAVGILGMAIGGPIILPIVGAAFVFMLGAFCLHIIHARKLQKALLLTHSYDRATTRHIAARITDDENLKKALLREANAQASLKPLNGDGFVDEFCRIKVGKISGPITEELPAA